MNFWMPDQAISESDWYEAAPAQQGLWILDRIERLRPTYLIPSVLEFSGPVDHAVLVSSIRQVLGTAVGVRLNVRRRQVEYRTDVAPPGVTFADMPAGGWPPEEAQDSRRSARCKVQGARCKVQHYRCSQACNPRLTRV
jgi:hypothetical protein